VLINRDLVDRTALAIVIAHELGHVFGLVHVAATTRLSLMNPGNVVTPPTDADQRALEAMWGACTPAAAGGS
jgi:predicted Zn-dependent protease